MRRSRILLVGCALLILASSARAADTLVGMVESTGEDSVQVMTKAGAVRSVHLDARTGFVKWITQRPWQQDTRVDRRALRAGECVAVELRPDDPAAAKLIRINTEPRGTVWNPCRR
ncbi:MAG: hypothetical protein DMF84_24615 [Acidobacteria bacterium]|nr:MAG: hypothetical protein DMF84_24615 [Acidobacteriota bacterium]